MDIAAAPSEELARDLENLRILNRWFGSYRLIFSFLRRWLQPGRSYRLVDLATGSGDIPREIVLWCRARDIRVTIDAVDFSAATLGIARKLSADFPEIRYHRHDIRTFSPARPGISRYARSRSITSARKTPRTSSSGCSSSRAPAPWPRICAAAGGDPRHRSADGHHHARTDDPARCPPLDPACLQREGTRGPRDPGRMEKLHQRRFASFRQALWIG